MAACPHLEWKKILEKYLEGVIIRLLRFANISELDCNKPLIELGFDSLISVELRDIIRKDLGIDVPVGQLMDDTSTLQLINIIINSPKLKLSIINRSKSTVSNDRQDLFEEIIF
ncbi:MAG: acyl carrier protein [Synechococcaceae cyanobacterium SM2_3_1]|nr:acyl carrier protein [Synechococcaceae cyanobacterium SM2_3_1]